MGELDNYVAEQQRAGYANEFIREQLRSAGWDEDSIVAAFNEAEEVHEDRKWMHYSVFMMLGVLVLTFGIVEFAGVTGYAPAGKIHCIMEDPQYPGNYDFVDNEADCMRLMMVNLCDVPAERLAVEGKSSVLFEAEVACRGRYANLYLPSK